MTKKILIAREDSELNVEFFLPNTITNVVPSCTCSGYTIEGDKKLILTIKTGKVAYGEKKEKNVHAIVTTEDGNQDRLEVSITVYKDEYYPISADNLSE